LTEGQHPLVSIIVRTKDRPKLLQRALRSIASQIYRPIEVLLVNDGGCDLAIDEIGAILGDVSLNYLRLEKNTGRAHAGNVGIGNAKGTYIGFLDDDDELYPIHVATLVSFLEQSDYKVAYTDSLMVYKEYNPQTHELNHEVQSEVAFSYDFNYDRLVFENYIPFMCLLFERKPIVTSGGFDTSFELYEDWDLLIRIGEHYSFYHIKQVTANYNQWSVDLQISQANKDPLFLRQAYLEVLSRHVDKITPNRIHDYMSAFAYTRNVLKDRTRENEVCRNLIEQGNSQINTLYSELQEKGTYAEHLVSELKEKGAQLENLLNELRGRDSQMERLYAELKEKGPRVENLYNELREKDSEVNALTAEVREKDARIDAIVAEVRQKDSQVAILSDQLKVKDFQMDALSIELRERDSQLVKLYTELRERDSQLVRLYTELRERDSRSDVLNAELHERRRQIDSLITALREKDTRLESLTSEVSAKNATIMMLHTTLRDREELIKAMKKTKGWRALEKYRKIRDRVFRPSFVNKGRDDAHVQALKSDEVGSRTGRGHRKSFADPAAKRVRREGREQNGVTNRVRTCLNDEPIKAKVSIIIPVKNAGEEFEYTLRRLKQQEGVSETELVIVDSGSDDRTLDIAQSHAEKIFRIPAEDFHHARTRNFGAEQSTGDLLVFTVQDAVPVSNCWLHKLLMPIYRGQASAVSARQIPRADADLFASWGMWVHNLHLGYDHDRVVSRTLLKNFDSLDLQTKRAAAGLDSVCLGIKRSVFESYRFHSDYAEDLDLGVRLLKDNHTLFFQSSNGIIHSHTRPAIYFLRRGYVDTVSLWKILQVERKDIPAQPILETISYLYSLLKSCIFTLNVESEFTKEPVLLIHSFLKNFERKLSASRSLRAPVNGGEPRLDKFLEQFRPNNHEQISSELFSAMKASLFSFSDFMKSFTGVDDVRADFIESLYKIFSNTSGCYLGANTRGKVDVLAGEI